MTKLGAGPGVRAPGQSFEERRDTAHHPHLHGFWSPPERGGRQPTLDAWGSRAPTTSTSMAGLIRVMGKGRRERVVYWSVPRPSGLLIDICACGRRHPHGGRNRGCGLVKRVGLADSGISQVAATPGPGKQACQGTSPASLSPFDTRTRLLSCGDAGGGGDGSGWMAQSRDAVPLCEECRRATAP